MESYWDKLPRSGLRFQISYFGWAIWMLYSLVIANLIIVFSLPLQFISKLRYRKLCDWIGMNSWPFFIYSLEFIGRNKVTVYSTQAIPKRENVLVLSNHCSYADWLMTFALAYRKERIGNVKISVKNVIKYIPFVGTSLVGMGFIFLSRDWESDKVKLKKAFHELKSLPSEPFWLLLHPEGSRVSPKKLKESQEFAKKRDLPVLEHVLLPRVKGFVAMMTELRSSIDAVYDITLAYSSPPPNFWSYFSGRKPIEVHMLVRRYPVKDIPTDTTQLSQWLYKIYAEKDNFLKEFHQHKKFTSLQPIDEDVDYGLLANTYVPRWGRVVLLSLIVWVTLYLYF